VEHGHRRRRRAQKKQNLRDGGNHHFRKRPSNAQLSRIRTFLR
jgi:hypothetical protein